MTGSRQVKLVSNVHPFVKAMCKEENSTAHLHASQGIHLKLDSASGEFITGYNLPYGVTDEEVLAAKKNDPLLQYKPLVEERLRLEKALRKKLTGGVENEYLETLYIVTKEKGKADKVFDLNNPKELFAYRCLLANKVAAMDFSSTLGSVSGWVPYYFEDATKKEETEKVLRRLRNVLRGILVSQDENKVWLYSVARAIGLEPSHDMSNHTINTMIDNSISGESSTERLKAWENIFKSPIQDLERLAIWYVGLYAMLILRGSNGNGYFIDNINFGESQDQVISSFGDPKHQDIYLRLREKVFNKLGVFK